MAHLSDVRVCRDDFPIDFLPSISIKIHSVFLIYNFLWIKMDGDMETSVILTTVPNESMAVIDNSQEDSNGYIDYSDRLETYIVPFVFGLIFLVGVVGNGCLIYILCRHKTMRSVPNTFIFNLALGDLLVLLCSVPFTSTVYTLDSWPYGEFVCKASEFAKVVI